MRDLTTGVSLITEHRVIELATGLCSIASPRPHEGRIADWLAGELERAGAQVLVQQVLPDRPNVLARVPGGPGPPLVLNGHIDASVHPRGWTHEPTEPWIESRAPVRRRDHRHEGRRGGDGRHGRGCRED